MPNRYEREIEEILRNLEQTDPKANMGQRFGERMRRKPVARARPRQRNSFSLSLSPPEWLLVTAILLALIAGGYAYIAQGGNTITGILAIAGLICVLLAAFSQFLFQPRRPAARYGNVRITPLRRGPFSGLKTQWNLFMLKLRYRRRDKH